MTVQYVRPVRFMVDSPIHNWKTSRLKFNSRYNHVKIPTAVKYKRPPNGVSYPV